ncbi:ABC transporter substrate-binding protein [Blastopirellula sp. J2-11]|uniref:ABC transporter substrate-binding protein n=1 Tax=Blastopirellula sp. J2-11 TaxID=2943192 RepID=UPI0021C68C51|nr:ABC transporter substrate-binding protein [Blastopirellula sp. J2-11]UUO05013.1 ABC transporter substrate-binding protein [Blastopirellula sp. J2-11]
MRSLLFCLIVSTFLGCGGPALPSNILIYGRGDDADRLDPIHTDIGESVTVMCNIYDTLVTYDEETLDLVPSLAESWSTSDDGLEWTFHLRKGVTFHDGTPLDADAVLFSLERLTVPMHPFVFDQVIPYVQSFEAIESVSAVDPLTVKVRLKRPTAAFLTTMAMFPASIVSPTAVKKYEGEFWKHPVGTGPFQFDSWNVNQQLTLLAFDDHWRGRPEIDGVIFLPVGESAVRVKQLLRGEIDIADNLPPAEIDSLSKNPEVIVQEKEGMNTGYLTMNNDKAPLDDQRIREAIWYAIDRDQLIKSAYSGHATKAVTLVPPTLWGSHSDLTDRDYDPAKAKQLLAAAAADGVPMPIRLQLFVMTDPRPYMQQPRQTAIFIKDSLAKVGIETEIVTNQNSQHFRRMTRGEHQLGLAGWTADMPDPDNFLYTLLDLDNINDVGGNNMSRYRSQKVHDLLAQAKVEMNQEKRAELYREAQEEIFADAPLVPLVHTSVRNVQSKAVSGYLLHPSSLTRLRLTKLAK